MQLEVQVFESNDKLLLIKMTTLNVHSELSTQKIGNFELHYFV